MDETEEQVQVALGTIMSLDAVSRAVEFALECSTYPMQLTSEEIIDDMSLHYKNEDETDAVEFLRRNEIKILEISKDMRGVLTEHFYNKWRQ